MEANIDLYTTSEASVIVTRATGTEATDSEVFSTWVRQVALGRCASTLFDGKRYRYKSLPILTEGEDYIKRAGRYFIKPAGITKLIAERRIELTYKRHGRKRRGKYHKHFIKQQGDE